MSVSLCVPAPPLRHTYCHLAGVYAGADLMALLDTGACRDQPIRQVLNTRNEAESDIRCLTISSAVPRAGDLDPPQGRSSQISLKRS
ncbi:MAG: hypothetical protein HQL37_01190 [Alphaproteobacteria bacterium]|nr:hypothetical protein [Alphaproteobacteria bacterium]